MGIGTALGAAVQGYRAGEQDKINRVNAAQKAKMNQFAIDQQQTVSDAMNAQTQVLYEQQQALASQAKSTFSDTISQYLESTNEHPDSLPDITMLQTKVASNPYLSKAFGKLSLPSQQDPVDVNQIKKLIVDQRLRNGEAPTDDSGVSSEDFANVSDDDVKTYINSGMLIKDEEGNIADLTTLIASTGIDSMMPNKSLVKLQAMENVLRGVALAKKPLAANKNMDINKYAVDIAKGKGYEPGTEEFNKSVFETKSAFKGNTRTDQTDTGKLPLTEVNNFKKRIGYFDNNFVPTQANIDEAAKYETPNMRTKYKTEISKANRIVASVDKTSKLLNTITDKDIKTGWLAKIRKFGEDLLSGSMDGRSWDALGEDEKKAYLDKVAAETQMGAILADYLNSVTGTDASVKEYDRIYNTFIGNKYAGTDSAKAAMTQFAKSMDYTAKSMIDAYIDNAPYTGLLQRKKLADAISSLPTEAQTPKSVDKETFIKALAKQNNISEEEAAKLVEEKLKGK